MSRTIRKKALIAALLIVHDKNYLFTLATMIQRYTLIKVEVRSGVNYIFQGSIIVPT